VLFVYVAAAFSVKVPWTTVIVSTLVPTFSLDREFLLMMVAVFGTTISPYLFFWQASQEAEESRLSHRRKYAAQSRPQEEFFGRIAADTWIGMLVSNIVAFFIIVTTAATLNSHGIIKIETAAQAAEALRPIAGELTFALFAAGIIGTGLLAVPVLAGSAAYAAAEAFGLPASLELPTNRAVGFYAIVAGATFVGAALTLTEIDPIAMLFWTAVINGIVAVPIMIAMMLLIFNHERPASLGLPKWLKLLGWLAAALMALAVALLGWSSFS
jgi:Mn2+/Fe2+ NRAMP family transporter